MKYLSGALIGPVIFVVAAIAGRGDSEDAKRDPEVVRPSPAQQIANRSKIVLNWRVRCPHGRGSQLTRGHRRCRCCIDGGTGFASVRAE